MFTVFSLHSQDDLDSLNQECHRGCCAVVSFYRKGRDQGYHALDIPTHDYRHRMHLIHFLLSKRRHSRVLRHRVKAYDLP